MHIILTAIWRPPFENADGETQTNLTVAPEVGVEQTRGSTCPNHNKPTPYSTSPQNQTESNKRYQWCFDYINLQMSTRYIKTKAYMSTSGLALYLTNTDMTGENFQ